MKKSLRLNRHSSLDTTLECLELNGWISFFAGIVIKTDKPEFKIAFVLVSDEIGAIRIHFIYNCTAADIARHIFPVVTYQIQGIRIGLAQGIFQIDLIKWLGAVLCCQGFKPVEQHTRYQVWIGLTGIGIKQGGVLGEQQIIGSFCWFRIYLLCCVE